MGGSGISEDELSQLVAIELTHSFFLVTTIKTLKSSTHLAAPINARFARLESH